MLIWRTIMNIDDLTYGQIKQLQSLFGGSNTVEHSSSLLNNEAIGKKCIIRTYSAGVWFGEVIAKTKDEVVLKNARRMYKWVTTDKGITLSEVSLTGVASESKIQKAVDKVWLQQIEIIPCTEIAIKNIEGQKDYVYA